MVRHPDIALCDAKSPLLPPKIALHIIAPPLRPCLEPPLSSVALAKEDRPHLPACPPQHRQRPKLWRRLDSWAQTQGGGHPT